MYRVVYVCETHFIAQSKRFTKNGRTDIKKTNYLLNSICVFGFRVEPTAPFHPVYTIWWQYLFTWYCRVSNRLRFLFTNNESFLGWQRLFNRFISYCLGDFFLVCFGFVTYFWHIASFSVVSCGFLIRCFD